MSCTYYEKLEYQHVRTYYIKYDKKIYYTKNKGSQINCIRY